MFTIDNHGPAQKKVSNGTKVQGAGTGIRKRAELAVPSGLLP